MRRTLLLVTALALLPAAPAAADKPVPLRAKLTSCTVGPEPSARSVTFTASLPRRTGAARLQLRFSLLQRLGDDGPFERVSGVPGWDRWETSQPGRPGLVLHRRVEGLAAPAAYRALVRFRWLDADGHVLKRLTRRTGTCEQPDVRPDLVLGALTALREGEGARYRLVVRNRGLETAEPFGLALVVGGRQEPAVVVGPIAGGEERIVEVLAAACAPGSPVEVLLDTGGDVAEARERDNAAVRRCPLV